jgi:putative ABC transport system permease protein
MTYPLMVVKNAFRNRFRTALTILGIAVAVLAFEFLRTTVDVWNAGLTAAAEDRLVTRHKVSITMWMPHTYYERIQSSSQDISAVGYANWVGMVYPKDEHSFFGNFAVDSDNYLAVYPEIVVAPDQLAAWKADPAGAIVGEVLAAKYGWKVGDRITLRGTIYPGDWTFNVRALYTTTNRAIDKSSFMFHWKYLNDGVPETIREQIGWFVIRVKDPTKGAAVAQAVDKSFESSEAETLTESERAFNLEFLTMYAAIFTALDVVSVVILLIMTMIVGNTIAMGVRERTHEYGVLRAIGFTPRHLMFFVFGESLIVTTIGAALGLLLALPMVNGFGKFIEDNFGSFFPYFAISSGTVALGAGLALLVGIVSAALPAWTASRLQVTGALRRLG